MKKKLRQMGERESGRISAVMAQGQMGRRIRDMGLVPGTPFEICGKAPLFDPVAIKIRGSVLALRNSEADFIEVEVTP